MSIDIRIMAFVIQIKQNIANRLKFEIQRRNLSVNVISKKCNLDGKLISAYLNGTANIKIEEIKIICEYLNINAVRLLFSKEYPEVNISFRNTAHNVQRLVSNIEDIFLLVKDFLPAINEMDIQIPKIQSYNKRYTEDKDLIAEAASYAQMIYMKYHTPLKFLETHNIPVLPLSYRDVEFDSFLLRHNKKILICINSAKPPQRILFSLAHEISHILFDNFIDTPVENYIPNFYTKRKITEAEMPEYFAYKFAEFLMLPFNTISGLIINWPRVDINQIQELLNARVVSTEVSIKLSKSI